MRVALLLPCRARWSARERDSTRSIEMLRDMRRYSEVAWYIASDMDDERVMYALWPLYRYLNVNFRAVVAVPPCLDVPLMTSRRLYIQGATRSRHGPECSPVNMISTSIHCSSILLLSSPRIEYITWYMCTRTLRQASRISTRVFLFLAVCVSLCSHYQP